MKGINCVGVFCEDIREEKSGSITLIGIMPDRVNTEAVTVNEKGMVQPGENVRMLPKLCIYMRLNFDPDIDLPEADIRLVPSDGEPISLGRIERKLIEKARSETKKKENFMAGLITRMTLGGFAFPPEGSLRLEVAFPNETILAGAMYFRPKNAATTSSSESPQLS